MVYPRKQTLELTFGRSIDSDHNISEMVCETLTVHNRVMKLMHQIKNPNSAKKKTKKTKAQSFKVRSGRELSISIACLTSKKSIFLSPKLSLPASTATAFVACRKLPGQSISASSSST